MDIKKIKKNKKVIIMGFAPDSRDLAPVDDKSFDVWPLNELYMERSDLKNRATAWFQLHGTEPPTIRDKNQPKSLSELSCPVFMWKKHRAVPNSITYPKDEILEHFDIYGEGMAPEAAHERDRAYFTNSVSWMIAMAIYLKYEEIHVYGVNMAQDQEFQHQRPSCEFFLGWARGAGIKVYLPMPCDLLTAWTLYGHDDSTKYMVKMEARHKELQARINGLRQQRNNAQAQINGWVNQENQLVGALEDTKYVLNLGPQFAPSERPMETLSVVPQGVPNVVQVEPKEAK
jgi:hypothetical protein